MYVYAMEAREIGLRTRVKESHDYQRLQEAAARANALPPDIRPLTAMISEDLSPSLELLLQETLENFLYHHFGDGPRVKGRPKGDGTPLPFTHEAYFMRVVYAAELLCAKRRGDRKFLRRGELMRIIEEVGERTADEFPSHLVETDNKGRLKAKPLNLDTEQVYKRIIQRARYRAKQKKALNS